MLIRVLPALIAGSLLIAAAAHALAPRQATAPELLPDLDQELSRQLVVTRAGREHRLGFRSAVRNVGAGPLEVVGSRRDRSLETMVADQAVTLVGAPSTLVRGVGRLRYVVSPDHRHWHLLGFQRYTLTRPDGSVVVRDRKTGFCLGDRYGSGDARFQSRCGLGQPALLGITQGISVGFGDDYSPILEGQYLRLTGLPAGRYVLVHRVNGNGRLREQRLDNNAASVAISLRWRRGMPRIKILARCPGSAACPTP